MVDTELYNVLHRSASVTNRGHSFKLYKVSGSLDVTKHFFYKSYARIVE